MRKSNIKALMVAMLAAGGAFPASGAEPSQLQSLAQLDHKKSEAAASVVITPDNVELNGAGNFEFSPEVGAFDVAPPDGGTGLSMTVTLWFDAAGQPLSCDTQGAPLAKAAQTACSQLMQKAKFELFPGMAMPLRRGFIDVRFSFFNNPSADNPGRAMFAYPDTGYRNMAIHYPSDETPPAQYLQRTDGAFSVAIDAVDYPPIALRNSLESVSAVLLGINRNGRVENCRPVDSDGARTAFLDNHTCALFRRRGRFEFNSDYQSYDGLRYLVKTMRWKLP